MTLHLGIGSWADPEYVGILYPTGLPAKNRLGEYARSFDHVEVNASYYSTPRASVVETWVRQTPPGFGFSVKLHRAFSQSPAKTAESGELVERLLQGVDPLVKAQRLRAFLLVLPPTFVPERRRLDELNTLAEKLAPHPLAVELRHSDWVSRATRALTLGYFRERGLVWVAVDMPQIEGSDLMPPVDEVTRPGLAYLRLHGRNPQYLEAKSAAEGHHYDYTARDLTALATRVRRLAEKAENVIVVANNHASDFAPKAALALKAKLQAD